MITNHTIKKKLLKLFNFYFNRGTKYVWWVGKIGKGFLKNSTVVKTAIYLNNDPLACYSNECLCQLDIFFS
jgi:hypothetical protein